MVSQPIYDKLNLETFRFVFSFFHSKKKETNQSADAVGREILVAAIAQLKAITLIPMLRQAAATKQ